MVNNHILKHYSEKKSEKKVRTIDRLIYFAAILMPLMTIPQIITVWIHKQTNGVSLWTWGLFTAFSVIWLWYAIAHKDRPLIINNILWILMQGMVFIGVLLF